MNAFNQIRRNDQPIYLDYQATTPLDPRTVIRPRARIEARLKGEGEVRGRLDGVTPRSLLGTTDTSTERATPVDMLVTG